MPSYQYKALNKQGQSLQGTLLAESSDSAQRQIKEKGLYLTKIKPVSLKRRVSNALKHKEVFYRQLASFLKGGKTLDQSLELVWETLTIPNLKSVVADLKERVHRGESLAQALSGHSSFFSPYDCAMVRTGEEAGQLASTFYLLATYLEKQNRLRTEIRSAIAYPIFVALFSFLTVLALFAFVIPTLESLYADLDQALPFVTQCLLGFSHFINQFGVVIALLMLAGLVLFRLPRFQEPIKEQWNKSILKMPKIGEWIAIREGGRLCSTLATLLESGMGLLPALKITQGLFQNNQYRVALEEIQHQVEKGVALGQALSLISLFPPLLTSLIRTGEESGHLKEQLTYLGEMFEEESTRKLKTFVTFLEPLMIVGVGIVIGIVVLAVILPIVQLNEIIS